MERDRTGLHKCWVTKFCAMTPNICGSWVCSLLHITLLVPGILWWLLDFWKICVYLGRKAHLPFIRSYCCKCASKWKLEVMVQRLSCFHSRANVLAKECKISQNVCQNHSFFYVLQKKDKNIAVISFVIEKMEINVSVKGEHSWSFMTKRKYMGKISCIEANSKRQSTEAEFKKNMNW